MPVVKVLSVPVMVFTTLSDSATCTVALSLPFRSRPSVGSCAGLEEWYSSVAVLVMSWPLTTSSSRRAW